MFKQLVDQCLQTSTNLKVSAAMNTSNLFERKDVYVYYPNYALPDLGFLKDKKYKVDSRIFLVPQHYNRSSVDLKKLQDARSKRQFSCNAMEQMKRKGISHVKDWESLKTLLPKELKEIFTGDTDCMETMKPSYCLSPKSQRRVRSCDNQKKSSDIRESQSSVSTQPSSGFRGSSTILNESELMSPQETMSQRFSKRSPAAVIDDDMFSRKPPAAKGILRKTSSLKEDSQILIKRLSATEYSSVTKEELAKRRSLQEPMEALAKKASRASIPESRGRSCDAMSCSCHNNICTGFCAKGLRAKNLMLVGELPHVSSSHEEFSEGDLAALRSQVSNFLVGRPVGGECDSCRRRGVGGGAGGQCKHVQRLLDVQDKQEADRPLVYDASDKKVLIDSVRVAVERIVRHCSKPRQGVMFGKEKLGGFIVVFVYKIF